MLRPPGVRSVFLGAVSRVLWYVFGVPCAWSLTLRERELVRWRSGDSLPGVDADGAGDDSLDARVASLRRALVDAGASKVAHVTGSFHDHLGAVRGILEKWACPEWVQVAGYGHTVYGSELFPVQLACFTKRRELQSTVGANAETLMFLYATTSQRKLYRIVARDTRLDTHNTHTSTSNSNGKESDANEDDGGEYVSKNDDFTNFYTGALRTLPTETRVWLLIMHAADIMSTLKDPEAVKRERHKKKNQFISYVFVIRLLRRALRAVREEETAEITHGLPVPVGQKKKRLTRENHPSLERSLLWTIGDLATQIGMDVANEQSAVTVLQNTRNELLFVARCLGVL